MEVLLSSIGKEWPLAIPLILGIIFFKALYDGQKAVAKEIKEAKRQAEKDQFNVTKQIEATSRRAKDQLDEFAKSAKEHWDQIENRMVELEDKVDRHLESRGPHQSCGEHQMALSDIISRTDRVQKGIVRMESWMMHMATARPIPAPVDEL